MKTLRYILIVIGVLIAVSVAAATFGTPYQPQRRGIHYTTNYTEMPTLSMSSTGSVMMKSGSTLPMAAVSGTTTANDCVPSGPHRAKRGVDDDEWEDEDPTDPEDPGDPTPIGDAVLPLLLMAMLFAGVIVVRKKRVVKVNG